VSRRPDHCSPVSVRYVSVRRVTATSFRDREPGPPPSGLDAPVLDGSGDHRSPSEVVSTGSRRNQGPLELVKYSVHGSSSGTVPPIRRHPGWLESTAILGWHGCGPSPSTEFGRRPVSLVVHLREPAVAVTTRMGLSSRRHARLPRFTAGESAGGSSSTDPSTAGPPVAGPPDPGTPVAGLSNTRRSIAGPAVAERSASMRFAAGPSESGRWRSRRVSDWTRFVTANSRGSVTGELP
jgi:hypothetical protein